MRKDLFLPGLAVAGGIAGFGVRRWQLASAYNPDTQLFSPGAAATWVLLALIAGLAAVFLLALSRGKKRPDSFLAAFGCQNTLFMTVMAAAAFLFLGAGLLGLMEGMNLLTLWRLDPTGTTPLTYPISVLLCALLCFPAGAAVLMLGRSAYRGEVSAAVSRLSSFPACAGLVWLFAIHLEHSTDPVLLRYVFFLAAAALLMLCHYYVAGFFFRRCRPRLACLTALLGTALALTSLADGLTTFNAALAAAFILSSLAFACPLLHVLLGPPKPKRLLDGRMPHGAKQDDGPAGPGSSGQLTQEEEF